MYSFVKRFFDLLFALFAIAILFIPLLPVIIGLLISGEHFVFYYQKRVGQHLKNFDIIKFATMLKNSPNLGTGTITTRNDPRVLPMGKFLRITKLNELPQILNVLIGNMSFVGPRPLVSKQFGYYPTPMQQQIMQSKPGITGIGSIVFRDEEELVSNSTLPPQEFYQTVISPYKGALEIWYSNNKSFLVDFLILIFTFWVIVFPKSKIVYKTFKGLPEKTF
jgi:lipopolysaccharide/colanic/teichoic acid biosynthesis glycosyltransferase